MNIEDLRNICLTLPGVTEDIKWENHLCFCIGEKMFLVAGLDVAPINASFKVNPDDFDELLATGNFSQAPYFAKRQWVQTPDISLTPNGDWIQLITQSYNLVKAKLTKKKQREIDALD